MNKLHVDYKMLNNRRITENNIISINNFKMLYDITENFKIITNKIF